MATYAAKTTVPTAHSIGEIQTLLKRYGASGFMFGESGLLASVMFEADGRRVRFDLPLPDPRENRFRTTPTGRARTSQSAASEAYEQEVRSLYRNLLLIIKAKLAAVEAKVTTFEQEFAPFMVLPDGSRVIDHIVPAIAEAYSTGHLPPLLGRPMLES